MASEKAVKNRPKKGSKDVLKHAKKSHAVPEKHRLAQPMHPGSIHAAPKHRSGIGILIGYSMILVFIYILYLLLGIYKPDLLFLGGTVRSYVAIGIDLVLLIALLYLIYGLSARKRWAWWFCIVWYAASIINSVWSVYVMRPNVYNILHELLILSSVFIILINALIVWYIYSKREVFTMPSREDHFGKKDKVFVYSLVCFWVLLLFISMSVGYNFYKKTTVIADSIVQELKDTTPLHAIQICETKDDAERDICFVVFVTIFEKYDLTPVCGRIESDLYRFSCMQAKGQ